MREKTRMKITYFQNNFSKYQLRPYSLRFRNNDLEVEYQGARFNASSGFYVWSVVAVVCMSVAGAISLGIQGKTTGLSFLSLNSFLHFVSFFLIKNDRVHLRLLIFLLNIYNTICYVVFLTSLDERLSVGQQVFLQDIFLYAVGIFMKTHTFVWDLLLIYSSRLVIFFMSLLDFDSDKQEIKDIILLFVLCIGSGFLTTFNLFKNEKLRRLAFLNSKQREQWNLIVDEVLPINVMISKYNLITNEIGLNASNKEAQINFKVDNDENFNKFMQSIRLDSPLSKRTLRDFILEKHHAIASETRKRQELNIKPLVIGNKKIITDLKSLNEDSPAEDNGSVSPSRVDRNPSIKKLISMRSVVNKKNSSNFDKEQKFFEILKGYYCEDWEKKPQGRCFYKIQVFQFSVNEPLLLVSVEDNSVQENIKILKQSKKQYHELFKDTLRFFQDRIVRLSTEIGQLAIPISQSNIYYDLKYSVMSIFTGIHNILDFVFEKNVQIPSSQQNNQLNGAQGYPNEASVREYIREKESSFMPPVRQKSQQLFRSTSPQNRKETASPKKSFKKDPPYPNASPKQSIEIDLANQENIANSNSGGNGTNGAPSMQGVFGINQVSSINPLQQLSSQTQQIKNQQQSSSNNNSNSNNNNNNNKDNKLYSSAMGNTKIRSFSLRKVLQEVSDVMIEKCRQKKVMFFCSDHMNEDHHMIQDQRRVKQVLFNYLQNSLEGIDKGYISISVRSCTNLGLKTYRFDILDSGPGVNEFMNVNDDMFSTIHQNTNNNQVRIVALRKKSQKQPLRKVSSFSNYFQNITSANPASKKKGLGIGMKVNQKIIGKLGPYFPKVFTEADTGTHIVYELYADILGIHTLKQRFTNHQMTKDRREEDIPEEDGYIGLSCYKYTRNEIYRFTKSSKRLISPDASFLNPLGGGIVNSGPNSAHLLQQQQLIPGVGAGSNSQYLPSVVQSMLNLNTPLIIPSNVSTIPGDNFNQSMPLRTPSSLLQVDQPSRHRPESMDNVMGVKVTRSNQFAIQNSQNNSFTLESFRSRDRSRNDSFYVDMNNRKRLLNQQPQNQMVLNLNGSDENNINPMPLYSNNNNSLIVNNININGNNTNSININNINGSASNPHNAHQNYFLPSKKISLHSLHDLSNYS